MKLNLNNRDKGLAIFFLILFSVLISIYLYKTIMLKRSGVYVIAKLDTIISAGNRGSDYDYTFTYNGKPYKCGIRTNVRLDTLIFVKVYSKNPSIYTFLQYEKVPGCLGLKDVPANGWKEVPNLKCNVE